MTEDSTIDVLLEDSGTVIKVPIEMLRDVRKLDGGYYLEVSFVLNRGYVINTPELESELKRLELTSQ